MALNYNLSQIPILKSKNRHFVESNSDAKRFSAFLILNYLFLIQYKLLLSTSKRSYTLQLFSASFADTLDIRLSISTS